MTNHAEGTPAAVSAKVTMGVRVLRKDGSVEDHGVQSENRIELSYDQAVEMLGREQADELFGVQGG